MLADSVFYFGGEGLAEGAALGVGNCHFYCGVFCLYDWRNAAYAPDSGNAFDEGQNLFVGFKIRQSGFYYRSSQERES